MNKKLQLALAVGLVFLVGCASIWTNVVTITDVVDAAMKDWAQMSKARQTSPVIDEKIIAAHDKYRAACLVAQAALIEYKKGGEADKYVAALQAVRASIDPLFALITPLISPVEAANLKANLAKASRL